MAFASKDKDRRGFFKIMAKFSQGESISQFQNFIKDVYGLPDDRLFSVSDLLSNQERFTMRALKGIRKGDAEKLKSNLVISYSWMMAVANRLHINMDDAVWRRFPGVCSYCGKAPCLCRKTKPAKRKIVVQKARLKPENMAAVQRMFSAIYPPKFRTIAEAGVHLAEEMGELSESIYCFLGEHKSGQFNEIKNEIADFNSCLFGVANSSGIDVAQELAIIYFNNCHICHKIPCQCSFSFVAKFKS